MLLFGIHFQENFVILGFFRSYQKCFCDMEVCSERMASEVVRDIPRRDPKTILDGWQLNYAITIVFLLGKYCAADFHFGKLCFSVTMKERRNEMMNERINCNTPGSLLDPKWSF